MQTPEIAEKLFTEAVTKAVRDNYIDPLMFRTIVREVVAVHTNTVNHLESIIQERNLIIHSIESASQCWKAEYDNCRAILELLVNLKEIKDSGGKTDDYKRLKPEAWKDAKKFLEKYQHEES